MDKYQDYVIKGNQFVGKFEEMYMRFDDPWHQMSPDNNIYSYSRNATAINLRRFKIRSVVEFGCGLGYCTNFLHETAGVKIKGVDISATAVQKARRLWPMLDFEIDKIQNVSKYVDYEAILMAEITWYVLPDLSQIMDKIYQNFRGRFLLHNLVFYKGQQRYGCEYFTNLKEFIDYIPFQVLGWTESALVESDVVETHAIFKIERKK